MTREQELERALTRLRAMFGLMVDEIGVDADNTRLELTLARTGADGQPEYRTETMTIAGCFAEADRLLQRETIQ